MRRSNEDERRWELRSESLQESSLNSDALVKRGWEWMRVEKREFAREFSQLWCAGQTRMRVDESWEARVCTRVLSTLMRRSNEDDRRWELRSESLHEVLLTLMRRSNEVRVDESWEVRVCTRVLSTLMRRSNEVRVDESWGARVYTRVLSTLMRRLKRGESWWELTTPDVIPSHSNKIL